MAKLGKLTLNEIELYEIDANPQTEATEASLGSFAILTDGTAIFQKVGVGDTDWREIAPFRRFLQYSNSTQQSTNNTATGAAILLQTNINSVPGDMLTKVNNTDFRCDFNGYIKAAFKMNMYPSNNDRSFDGFLVKNESKLEYSSARAISRDEAARGGSVSGSVIVPCSVGDVFRFHIASVQGQTITLPIGQALCYIEVYEEVI